jgi:hypothetical protein
VARELAGRASARLLPALGIAASRHVMLRVLLKIPLPALTVPRVLGIDLSRARDYPDCPGCVAASALVGTGSGSRRSLVSSG